MSKKKKEKEEISDIDLDSYKPILLDLNENKRTSVDNNQNGLYILVGKQGSGKTAFATRLIVLDYESIKRRVFANYNLYGIPFQRITLGNEREEKNGAIDILKAITKDPDYFNNSIIVIDEGHIYFDSKDYFSNNQRALQNFFSQLRKRNILLAITTQRFMGINITVRAQAKFLMYFEPQKVEEVTITTDSRGKKIKKTTSYELFNVELFTQEAGYSHPQPIKRKPDTFDLRDYFKYYNTREVIT